MPTVLIANHGLSAAKFSHSVREWRRMPGSPAIELIGLVTPEDLEANFEYIRLVDRVHEVHNGIYTDMPRMLQAIKDVGPDMVWPGWGYFSENEDFARALEQTPVRFLGPSSEALHRLGDKMECVALGEKLNVPMLPWSGPVPVETLESVTEHSNRIGYPVMLKAALGGGGRGIRPVRKAEDLETVFKQVRAEVAGPIFVTKLAENCRHVEVQLIGDGEKTMHLWTRDCSVQRRNQKLIEEGPAPNVPDETLESMQKHAARMAEAVGYNGVGTAEFLFEPSSGGIYFLEINPRLQVEHVVSEMLSDDLNLPAAQVQLGLGKKLTEIPDLVRAAARQAKGEKPPFHCIAARITAENPHDGYRPSSGPVRRVKALSGSPHSWSYWSIAENGGILSSADGQFGHVFARGRTRDQARMRLREALSQLKIDASIFHTAGILKDVLATGTFERVDHHTRWLEPWTKAQLRRLKHPVVASMAVWLASDAQHKVAQTIEDGCARGHPPPCKVESIHKWEVQWGGSSVLLETRSAPGSKAVYVRSEGGDWHRASVDRVDQDCIRMRTGEKIVDVRCLEQNDLGWRMRIGHETHWFPAVVDPGVVLSPVSGRIITLLKGAGEVVSEGEAIAELEAMKMVVQVHAPASGKVTWDLATGDRVNAGEAFGRLAVEGNQVGGDSSSSDDETFDLVLPWELAEPGKMMDGACQRFLRGFAVPEHFALPARPGAKGGIKRTTSFLNERRLKAEKFNATYILDWPSKFPLASKGNAFLRFADSSGSSLIENPWPIKEEDLPPQQHGMMAWKLVTTDGVEVVVLANDITWYGGSFGPNESAFYVAVSKYARERGLPRLHISANAGAMIKAHVQLKEVVKPHYGAGGDLEYLYLEEKDYRDLQDQVDASRVEKGWRVEAITGGRGLGVENLHFSSEMAREMVLAREQSFTLTYVTSRSVGIGAYLAKLGERIVQRDDSSLLLTGYRALNDLLGQDLYTGNHQLGGVGIMGNNGLTHLVVRSDEEAAYKMLEWVRFLPKAGTKAVVPSSAPWSPPPVGVYDVRKLIEGIVDDRTWVETLQGWAPSVVVGRARIQGQSFGIVAAQCKNTPLVAPADPGDPTSSVVKRMRAGCVWFPESSAKTARALEDFRLEGLPTLILANWRGFSGGTRDMFDEILKHGSEIVNTLVKDGPPVKVYVPPFAQLRGGAMVVVCSGINPDRMELACDPNASLGVLEPEAAAPILWKRKPCLEQGVEFARLQDVPARAHKQGVVNQVVPLDQLGEWVNA